MRRPSILLVLATIAACGAPEPPDEPASELPDFTTGLELAARDFGVDPYEIGREWYKYDGSVHVVTPEPWVYVVFRADEVYAFDLESYYDEVGESGVFTLSAAKLNEGWSEPSELTTQGNVKMGAVCATIDPLAEVDCTGTYDLVFRTAWRAIPAGGFAVQEPAVYVRNHFSLEDTPVDVAIVEAESIADVSTDRATLDAFEKRPSVARDALHGRVGWVHDAPTDAPRDDIQLHITSNLQVAQWRIDGLDGRTLAFSARCQRLQEDQAPFEGAATTFDVSLPSGRYGAALVRICDAENDGVVAGAVVDELSAPPLGLWPDAKTFDLIVEQLDDRIAIRLAPGHLLWNWTRGTERQNPEFDPIDLDAVWEEQLLQ